MGLRSELSQLHSDLMRSGFNIAEAQTICGEAESEISGLIALIVENAVDDALSYSVSIGADEFVDDMTLIDSGDGVFTISTHSGNLDYSSDKVEMLPHLLSNPKIAQDGHKYKTIPITDSPNVKRSMFDVLQNSKNKQDLKRTDLKKNGNSALAAAKARIAQKAAAMAAAKQNASSSGEPNFRTASEKQDKAVMWVKPEKDADMSSFIEDLNRNIMSQSSDTINDIMISYRFNYIGT